MNNEQQLLVSLVKDRWEREIKSYCLEDIDWESFIRSAHENRVVSMVVERLGRRPDKLPLGVYTELRGRAEKCAMRNLNLRGQLIQLAKVFRKHEIEFIAYKGPTLGYLAYGSESLRQFGDLDLLVHKKDFPRIKKAILESGGAAVWDLTTKQEQAVQNLYYEYPFKFGENPAVLVEIHWAFMESFFGFDLEKDGVFHRTQAVRINGVDIPTLSNEDMLLVLCVHGSKHFWKRLIWICDVGKLIQSQRIDWKIVLARAEKLGCSRMLALGSLLARNLLELDLPRSIESLISQDKVVVALAAELNRKLFDKNLSAESLRVGLHLKMRERWHDKFNYARRLFETKLVDSLFMPLGRPR